MVQLRTAESEVDVAEALKLYRDMNHLSLAGGITCEQVISHVQSHTIMLYFCGGQAEEHQTVPKVVNVTDYVVTDAGEDEWFDAQEQWQE